MALDLMDNLPLKREGLPPQHPGLWVLLALAILAVVGVYGYRFYQRPQAGRPAPAAKLRPAVAPATPAVLTQINALAAGQQAEAARQKCYQALAQGKDPAAVAEIEKILGKLNVELATTPAAMAEKAEYVVQTGDSLEKLAKKFGTTVDLIRKGNAIQGPTIHAGDCLRIFSAKMVIVISKSRNDLLLKAQDRFFKRYPVGTGKFGTTPAGKFLITDKIVEPPWWRPDGKVIPYGDKENVLGTRWLSLTAAAGTPNIRGYGIHGTWEPDTVGRQASAGCVRLVNSDVEELFMLVPIGTPVVISE